jgi:hypothetical protein
MMSKNMLASIICCILRSIPGYRRQPKEGKVYMNEPPLVWNERSIPCYAASGSAETWSETHSCAVAQKLSRGTTGRRLR